MSSSTTPQPPIARLLCRKSCSSRFPGGPWVVTSPPDGAAPVGTTPTGATPAALPTAASSADCMTDPGIENAVSDVRDKIPEHRRDADDQRRAQQDREVVAEGRLPEQQ